MESKYYTPKIEDFTQGFEFEYLDIRDYRMVLMDFENGDSKELSKTHVEEWQSRKVWWKHPVEERIIIKEDGITYDISGGFVNFFAPFSNETLLKLISDGRIRIKR